jgi:hypothetical protein
MTNPHLSRDKQRLCFADGDLTKATNCIIICLTSAQTPPKTKTKTNTELVKRWPCIEKERRRLTETYGIKEGRWSRTTRDDVSLYVILAYDTGIREEDELLMLVNMLADICRTHEDATICLPEYAGLTPDDNRWWRLLAAIDHLPICVMRRVPEKTPKLPQRQHIEARTRRRGEGTEVVFAVFVVLTALLLLYMAATS